MTKSETKLAELARVLAESFTTDERNEPNEMGEKTFTKLVDEAPQWITDAIRDAHEGGEIFPHDWIYAECSAMADHMNETEPDSWDDAVSEWADGRVDVYNNVRARWLASHLAFGAIVDEAVAELGHSDQGVYGDIGIGQYVLLERIAYAMIRGVRGQVESEA